MDLLRPMWPPEPDSYKRWLGSALKDLDDARLAQLIGQR
jgi:hypothetical protein